MHKKEIKIIRTLNNEFDYKANCSKSNIYIFN